MGIIRVLPERIANKIAAGEVIERPASIVKELIENALDSQAKEIDVAIQHGGKGLIRVSDDGSGMDREDAKLAFQRHATSKITIEEDLEGIGSFGFRGEALPSIAAVSKTRLITRPADSPGGTEVVIEGGSLRATQDHPCRKGTIVEVRDLFFNTPARRKFLKADSTEMGHVMEVVSHLALAAMDVRFRLKIGEKTVLDLVPVKRLVERAAAILGEETARDLLEMNAGEEGIRVWGLIGKPALNKANRTGMNFFINRRWVKSLSLSYAVQAGYQGLLMHGRYPVVALFLDLDLARVDVNVHPTKQEVRISHDAEVTGFIQRSVKELLGRTGDRAPKLQLPPGLAAAPEKIYHLDSSTGSTVKDAAWDGFSARSIRSGDREARFSEPIALKDSLRITKILGSLHNTFIVAETEDGFVLVDQHAAHERIVFEALLRNFRSGQSERQTLLLDEVLELHPKQIELFKRSLPLLAKVGFEIDEFGERSFVIRAYPAVFGEVNPVQLIRTFLEEQEEGKLRTALDDHQEAIAALCACKKQSVKAHDPMAPQAMRALLERLAACENPFNCPHGRPAFFTQTFSDLEKQFKRI